MKKAQSWSIDVMIGVVVFLSAFLIFYTILNSDPAAKTKKLKEDASVVIKTVSTDDSQLRVIDQNQINESKLLELKNFSYEELKRQLRIEGDFCIFLEDEQGNIILINNLYKGIGTPNVLLNGTPCSNNS